MCHQEVRSHPCFPLENHEWSLDFDSTLGFPGEGWVSHSLVFLCFAAFWCGVVTVGLEGGPSHGDAARQHARQGIQLTDGRRVTQTTAFTREWLFSKFIAWLEERRFDVNQVVFAQPLDIDALNDVLVQYGKWLFSEGKPYYHFSELVNAVTSKRPAVRRAIQQSWDLAFLWGSYEPATHHVAMPAQVLVSVISVAFVWGWSREAAVFALAWGALLRIGEVLKARRADLIMPSDLGDTIDHALLRILEPKTRFRAARHQTGKLEQPDLIEIIRIGFGHLHPSDPLWPFSGSTLRLRLASILAKLELPTKKGQKPKPLSLASFRPGGATWLITQTESAEVVMRRGRWASRKVMDCYLQEVTSLTYLNEVSATAKKLVLKAVEAFPSLLRAVIHFHRCKIPEPTWFFLFQPNQASRF